MDGIALADDGKFPLFFFVVVLIALVKDLPARHGNGLAVGDEGLVGTVDGDPRLVVFVDGIELGQIGLSDEIVDALLDGRQFFEGAGNGRRDDGVVSRDLAVVPGPALDLAVGAGAHSGSFPAGMAAMFCKMRGTSFR